MSVDTGIESSNIPRFKNERIKIHGVITEKGLQKLPSPLESPPELTVLNINSTGSGYVLDVNPQALGVLQEQGVYALFLLLLSKSGKETAVNEMTKEEFIACKHASELLNLLKEKELAAPGVAYKEQVTVEGINSSKEEILKHFLQAGGILENLDKLLLIRDLYEQTLIYTRYAAKAREEGK